MKDEAQNESRMTALTRLAAGQDRLEKHMITLVKTLKEEREASKAQFRPAGEADRPAGARTGDAGAALAADYFHEGHRGVGSIGIVSRYIEQSLL